MKTKFAILFLSVVLAVSLGWLVRKADRPEPLYQGKPVSYWINEGFSLPLGSDDRPPAESAFRSMGSNAVPFLIATLGKTDGPLKRIYIQCYSKLPAKFNRQMPRPCSADTIRGRAILALTLIGPTAKAAIPSLLNVLTHDPDRMRRANTVACLDSIDDGQLQEEVVDALKRARCDTDPYVARRAIETLKRHFPLGFSRLPDPR